MKLLDRYIASEFSKKFLLFFILLNTFVFFSDVYTHLEKFLSYHAFFQEIFYYYIAIAVVFLPLTIPLTFVTALTFSFCMMHRNREIISLLSSGLSFFRITRMLWFFGLVTSLISLLSSFHWIPKAQIYSDHYLESIEMDNAQKEGSSVKHLTFNAKNRLWYINCYDKNEACASGITVYDDDDEGTEYRRIEAQIGHFNEKESAWVLKQGREILFHPKTQIADEIHAFEQRTFKELDDSPELMLLFQLHPKSLSLPQLKKAMDYEIQKGVFGNTNYKMYFGDTILGSIFCFLSCWVVLPLLFSTVQKNFLQSIIKMSVALLSYAILSHILYALGKNNSLHWLSALLIPIGLLSILLLWGIRKLL